MTGTNHTSVPPENRRPVRGKGKPGPRSLQARIQEQYAVLPGSERKVADLILDFPGEVAAYSATELAQLAGASKAAVTRLIRRLDYASFEEARRAARDAQTWGSPVYLLSKDADRGAFDARVQNHIEQDVRNITRTFEGIDEGTLEAIVDAIAGARRVWLFGHRNSHYLAGYLRWQLIQVRGDVHILPAPGETLAEYMAELRPDDLLVVLGFRRRIPDVERAMDSAAAAGVPVLLITDPTARLGSGATWTVRCEVRGEDLFDRYSAAMSFLHFLAVAVVARTGAAGRRRLALIEGRHEDLDAFG
jgi:DNA-binding MurR/RpiR family transcriptional regulator